MSISLRVERLFHAVSIKNYYSDYSTNYRRDNLFEFVECIRVLIAISLDDQEDFCQKYNKLIRQSIKFDIIFRQMNSVCAIHSL
jgi:hypothetical protein